MELTSGTVVDKTQKSNGPKSRHQTKRFCPKELNFCPEIPKRLLYPALLISGAYLSKGGIGKMYCTNIFLAQASDTAVEITQKRSGPLCRHQTKRFDPKELNFCPQKPESSLPSHFYFRTYLI
jgi:hypothetical protein